MSTSPCYVEHQLVDLVRWKEEDGAIRELEINSNRAHNWTQNAARLGLELEDIETTECHHKRIEPSISGKQRINDTLHPSKYPKSIARQELSNLLEDAKLGEAANDLIGVHKMERGDT